MTGFSKRECVVCGEQVRHVDERYYVKKVIFSKTSGLKEVILNHYCQECGVKRFEPEKKIN